MCTSYYTHISWMRHKIDPLLGGTHITYRTVMPTSPGLLSASSQRMQEDLHPEEDYEAQEEIAADPNRLQRLTPDFDEPSLTQPFDDFHESMGARAFDASLNSSQQDTAGPSVDFRLTSTGPTTQQACAEDRMDIDHVAATPESTSAPRHRRRTARAVCAQAVPESAVGTGEAPHAPLDTASTRDPAQTLLDVRELVEDCATESLGAGTEDIPEDLQMLMQVRCPEQVEDSAHVQHFIASETSWSSHV